MRATRLPLRMRKNVSARLNNIDIIVTKIFFGLMSSILVKLLLVHKTWNSPIIFFFPFTRFKYEILFKKNKCHLTYFNSLKTYLFWSNGKKLNLAKAKKEEKEEMSHKAKDYMTYFSPYPSIVFPYPIKSYLQFFHPFLHIDTCVYEGAKKLGTQFWTQN